MSTKPQVIKKVAKELQRNDAYSGWSSFLKTVVVAVVV